MQVDELLEAIDRLHREAFSRLAGLLSHHQLLEHACADPVVGMAFELYDMRPEEILGDSDEVAPESSGEAEGGARPASPLVPTAPASPLVPNAPASPLVRTPRAPSRPSGFVRLEDIRRIPAVPAATEPSEPAAAPAPPASSGRLAPAPPPPQPPAASGGGEPEPRAAGGAEPPVAATGHEPPEWTELFGVEHVPSGSMAASSDAHVLICNVEGTLHAVRNRCGGGPLPLHLGKLVDGGVTCPWHRGCRYDLDTGESTSGRRTVVYPVRAEDGTISVALNQGRATGPLQPADLRAAPM